MIKEFHINKKSRDEFSVKKELFYKSGRLVFFNVDETLNLYTAIENKYPEYAKKFTKEDLFTMAIIQEINHILIENYAKKYYPNKNMFAELKNYLLQNFIAEEELNKLVLEFVKELPPREVYFEGIKEKDYIRKIDSKNKLNGFDISLEEIIILYFHNVNPAYMSKTPFLFSSKNLEKNTVYKSFIKGCKKYFAQKEIKEDLMQILFEPILKYPDSLEEQLKFLFFKWGDELKDLKIKILEGISSLREVREYFQKINSSFVKDDSEVIRRADEGIRGEREVFDLEYEGYTHDKEWMPNVVVLAKNILVWLYQLKHSYQKEIKYLNDIPQQELIKIKERGFTSIWFIGIWERSRASKKLKHIMQHDGEKEASAYSLLSYDVSASIGGWESFYKLKERASKIGLDIACDMVPNHMGIDSNWVIEHPDWFIQSRELPYNYSFNGENLSFRDDVGIFVEDGYYSGEDAAVVFKRVDYKNNDLRYIYHGNDGTSTPWNDTAQINFLNEEAKNSVINTILHIAKEFKIIRLDAAMVLRRANIQRLWFPNLSQLGKCIPSRDRYGFMKTKDFERAMPKEFWREVVDRVNVEAPDTLLLAEAFWLSEDYFVRTLGMHRVYNSAFMVMLSKELNQKHRELLKKTIAYDREILKRYVNYLSNPDEETAIEQFGEGDKYFGACTLLVTMPGLPMFAHGQIEGFKEKYGMEYTRSYHNESEDENKWFVERHKKEIFPLLQKRYIFSNIEHFYFYDFICDNNSVNENVYAYSNESNSQIALVVYNNSYHSTSGFVNHSLQHFDRGSNSLSSIKLGDALHLNYSNNNFVIFKEFKNNLFYIRNSKDVFDNGIKFLLKGYESNVFMDFVEIYDDSGIYHEINNSLNGSGVRNFEREIKIRKDKDLFDSFSKFFSKKFFENIDKIHNKKKLSQDEIVFFDKNFDKLVSELKKSKYIKSKITGYSSILEKAFKIKKLINKNLQTIFTKELFTVLVFFLFEEELSSFDLFGEINYICRDLEDFDFRSFDENIINWSFLSNFKSFYRNEINYKTLLKFLKDNKERFELNSYNNILWFNKERFENIMNRVILINVLIITEIESKKAVENLEFLQSVLKLANDCSYDFEKFLEKIKLQ